MIPILEARALSAGYGKRVVVRSVSFSAEAGKLLVILGCNGSGKTTILKTCLGFLPALEGQSLIGGDEISSLPPRERARRAAWVPQSASSVWAFAVRDMVAQGRYAGRGAFAAYTAADRAAIEAALLAMDIAELAERDFSSLSGGEARRVLIARALAQETPLIVLDEPAANLDPGRQMELMEMLSALAHGGKAVAASMHDVNAARRFADTALLIAPDGSAIFGTPELVLSPENIETAYDTHFIHGSHEQYGSFVLPLTRKRSVQ